MMIEGGTGSSDPRFHPCPARNRSPARYRNTHPSPFARHSSQTGLVTRESSFWQSSLW